MRYFLALLLVCLSFTQSFAQQSMNIQISELEKQKADNEFHEALSTANGLLSEHPGQSWLYVLRAEIFLNLGDRQSAMADMRQAKKMGYGGLTEYANYLMFPEYLANEVARGFVNEPLKAENGFRLPVTRKDSLQGGLRPERDCFDVVFYDLKVEPDPLHKTISGSNAICFRVLSATRTLQIDLFAELAIGEIKWRHQNLSFRREFNAIFVDFPDILVPGDLDTLLITYSGAPHVAIDPPWNGGFVWEKKKGAYWVGVACEHLGASCWWPNKDYIADRPDSMRITVITPPDYQGISNGNLRSLRKAKDYWTFEWFVSYPIANYLVTLYLGNFINQNELWTNSSGSMSLDYYVLPHNEKKARQFYSQTRKIIEVYEKLYGDYPFFRDGAAWVEAPYAGMENQGAIAIGDEYGAKKRRIYDQRDYDYLLIHETAHEWWGNAVGMREMADAWISEGFTTYSECLFMEDVYGYNSYMNLVVSDMSQILNIWPMVGRYGVNDNTFLGSDIYVKGAVMLHNLRCLLNNDTLFIGMVRSFYQLNRYKTVTTKDFINHANRRTGINLTPFFKKFLFEAHPPVLLYDFFREGNNILFSYKWINVDDGFEMPFLLFTGEGHQIRLEGTTHFKSVMLENTKTFLVANAMRFPKNILRNSLTYFETYFDHRPAVITWLKTGKRRIEGHQYDSLKVGTWNEFYAGDTLCRSVFYLNGRLEGRVTSFSVAGQKISEMNYKTDTLEGDFRLFYENGAPEITGSYAKGKQCGEWNFFNPAGSLVTTAEFINGDGRAGSRSNAGSASKGLKVDSIYSYVNFPPHYPGGEAAMYAFVKSHLVIPSRQIKPQPAEVIILSAVVTPIGTLRDFKIELAKTPEIADALLKAMQQMSFWAPGYLNGQPANVKIAIPFRLNNM